MKCRFSLTRIHGFVTLVKVCEFACDQFENWHAKDVASVMIYPPRLVWKSRRAMLAA